MQITQIIEGWGNLIKDKLGTLHPPVKAVAEIRLKICDECSIRKNNICDSTQTITNIITKKPVKGCGCNIAAKTLAMSAACPASKW